MRRRVQSAPLERLFDASLKGRVSARGDRSVTDQVLGGHLLEGDQGDPAPAPVKQMPGRQPPPLPVIDGDEVRVGKSIAESKWKTKTVWRTPPRNSLNILNWKCRVPLIMYERIACEACLSNCARCSHCVPDPGPYIPGSGRQLSP